MLSSSLVIVFSTLSNLSSRLVPFRLFKEFGSMVGSLERSAGFFCRTEMSGFGCIGSGVATFSVSLPVGLIVELSGFFIVDVKVVWGAFVALPYMVVRNGGVAFSSCRPAMSCECLCIEVLASAIHFRSFVSLMWFDRQHDSQVYLRVDLPRKYS